MTIFESIRIAMRALQTNKLRSSLTMLGIIIGVGAVIAMMAVGAGAQDRITAQIQGLGSNLLFIRPGATLQNGLRTATGTAATLTYEDAQAISDPSFSSSISAVAPEADSFGQVLAGGLNVNTRVVGVTPEYQNVRNAYVAEGTFFDKTQLDSRANVAILGASVAQSLFPNSDPLGQIIKINNQHSSLNFRVIGVLQAKGAQALGSQDDQVLIPLTTLQERLSVELTPTGGHTISVINVQLTSMDHNTVNTVTQQISDLLLQRHHVTQADFTIQSQADLLSTVSQVTGVMTILLASIAGISLVVGGIGIMNIMLVSVTERTREIGIRKAIGAKRKDILLQFLVEALVVSILGGMLGLMLGVGLADLVGNLQMQGQSIPTQVTATAVLLATGVSAAIGLFFGIYPASRASRLSPIEALRYE